MNPEQKLAALRAIDKLDRLGLPAVRELLTDGRRDESGAFQNGAGLRPDQADILIAFLDVPPGLTNAQTIQRMARFLLVLTAPELSK